jgi:hypothetical protein
MLIQVTQDDKDGFEVQEFSIKRGLLGCSFGDEKHVLKEILKTWVDMM